MSLDTMHTNIWTYIFSVCFLFHSNCQVIAKDVTSAETKDIKSTETMPTGTGVTTDKKALTPVEDAQQIGSQTSSAGDVKKPEVPAEITMTTAVTNSKETSPSQPQAVESQPPQPETQGVSAGDVKKSEVPAEITTTTAVITPKETSPSQPQAVESQPPQPETQGVLTGDVKKSDAETDLESKKTQGEPAISTVDGKSSMGTTKIPTVDEPKQAGEEKRDAQTKEQKIKEANDLQNKLTNMFNNRNNGNRSAEVVDMVNKLQTSDLDNMGAVSALLLQLGRKNSEAATNERNEYREMSRLLHQKKIELADEEATKTLQAAAETQEALDNAQAALSLSQVHVKIAQENLEKAGRSNPGAEAIAPLPSALTIPKAPEEKPSIIGTEVSDDARRAQQRVKEAAIAVENLTKLNSAKQESTNAHAALQEAYHNFDLVKSKKSTWDNCSGTSCWGRAHITQGDVDAAKKRVEEALFADQKATKNVAAAQAVLTNAVTNEKEKQ